MSYKGKLIFILGVSGSGKNTIMKELLKSDLNLKQVISCKTRPLRPDEQNGVDFHYMTQEEFDKAKDNDEFLEYALVHKLYWYSTRKKDIVDKLITGENVIKEIDIQGLIKISENHPDVREVTRSVFLDIDNELMVKRITNRSPLSEEEITERLESAEWERELAKKYCTDVIDGSGTIEEETARVYAIIKAYLEESN